MVLYYQGSYIQITPDNKITIHQGPDETSGTQIQLSDGKVYIQAPHEINITSGNEVKIEAKNITLDAESSIKIKGDTSNTCAVNSSELINLLSLLATIIDTKLPATFGSAAA